MNVAIIQAPAWGVYGPPAGPAQLSACLRLAGHDSRLFDLNAFLYNGRTERYRHAWAIEQSGFWDSAENVRGFWGDNEDPVLDYIGRIAAFKPDLICFSVNVCSWHATVLAAARLKERLPGVPVVIGGPPFLVDFRPEDYLCRPEIDFIVYGEAERTLPALAAALAAGEEPAGCAGICFKRGGGIVKTAAGPVIRDLDELPFMDLTGASFSDYAAPRQSGRRVFSMMTSRGCVERCVFCGPCRYWPGFRAMSGKRIYSEIENHFRAEPAPADIDFLDLLINGNMKALLEFCGLVAGGPLKGRFGWHANLRVRKEMTAEVFRLMAAAGCRHVTFGIESGSQKVLDAMRKNYRVEDADIVLANARLAGIGTVTCNFMFGFPGETREDFALTLEFLKRNRENITVAYPSRSFCAIEPHSYMQEHIGEFDMVPNPRHGQYWTSRDGANNYLERMARCDEFSRLALELGVKVGLGLQTSYELDRCLNLGDYYNCTGDPARAAEYWKKYLELDPANAAVRAKLSGRGRS